MCPSSPLTFLGQPPPLEWPPPVTQATCSSSSSLTPGWRGGVSREAAGSLGELPTPTKPQAPGWAVLPVSLGTR